MKTTYSVCYSPLNWGNAAAILYARVHADSRNHRTLEAAIDCELGIKPTMPRVICASEDGGRTFRHLNIEEAEAYVEYRDITLRRAGA